MLKRVVLILSVVLFAHSAHSKVYQSLSSEFDARLVIVPAEEDGRYLLGFDGFDHEFDGQAMLYEKRRNTQDARDGYYYQMVNMPLTTVRDTGKQTLIHGTRVPYLEVHLGDRDPVAMVLVSGADVAMENRLEERYQERQALPISQVAAKKAVGTAAEKFQVECSSDIEPEIPWSEFEGEDKAVPGLAAHYLNSLVEICNIDSDYQEAVQALSSISFDHSADAESHSIELDNGTLRISLAASMENVKDASHRDLLDSF